MLPLRGVLGRWDIEASGDRVVGWLQRAALWLAGIFMLLQTRTIRNKLTPEKPHSCFFVAADQQGVPRCPWSRRVGATAVAMLQSNKSYRLHKDYQFEQLIAVIYDSPHRVVFQLPMTVSPTSTKETPCP
ncbi:hypothetical protein [Hydrogenophaga sp. SL48]|uniref:hypothetical protein n=1 Tax=Hydrogenophaga sp. SL48 TaxID=2806347 RepID=UPI001F34D001|nr:hypothetical protein [Hydrogenophaga sp. SL48]UJW83036.1 hypothetical protein IM738_10380 [Hydrogenophaga sp. SL48]